MVSKVEDHSIPMKCILAARAQRFSALVAILLGINIWLEVNCYVQYKFTTGTHFLSYKKLGLAHSTKSFLS